MGVFMLHRVPFHIRVSPETRQRLRRLCTERHLNVGAWLRALIDEPLDREFGPAPTDAKEPVAPVGSAPNRGPHSPWVVSGNASPRTTHRLRSEAKVVYVEFEERISV